MASAQRRRYGMAAMVVWACAASVASADPAGTSSLPWRTTGGPGKAARSGNVLYLANVYDPRPVTSGVSGLAVFSTTEAVAQPMAAGDDYARVVVSDGAGGWFVAGPFGLYGGQPHRRLAHVFASGVVDPAFVADVTGSVGTLAVSGTTLVAGGNFTAVNGIPRQNLAVVSTATGAVLGAAPAVNGEVFAVAITGSTLYVGGDFTSAGGQARNGVAAFSAITGALVPAFTATLTGSAELATSLLVVGSSLFIGGSFTAVNGLPRVGLAKVSAATGVVDGAWRADANGLVHSMAFDAGDVLVGGAFTAVGGQQRLRAAAISAQTGGLSDWAPVADSSVQAIAVDRGIVYLAGSFGAIAGQARLRAGAVSRSSPAVVLPWNPSLSGDATGLAIAGDAVAVAGPITGAGHLSRPRGVLAVDLMSGDLLPFHAAVAGEVTDIVATESRLVMVGDFTSVAGVGRTDFAVFDLASGALASTTLTTNGAIEAVLVVGDVAYFGGSFTFVNSQIHGRLAAIDLTSGRLLPWFAAANDTVFDLALVGGDVMIGGRFTTMLGTNGTWNRQGLARVTAGSVVTAFDAGIATGGAVTLATRGATLYFGGDFTLVQGATRRYAAAVHPGTGSLMPWNPDFDGTVRSLGASPAGLYAVGNFAMAGGQARPRGIARVTATGTVDAWEPSSSGTANNIAVYADGVVVSGAVVTFLPEAALGGQPGAPVQTAWRAIGATVSVEWQPPILGPRPASYLLEAGTGPGLANLGTLPVAGTSFAVGGVPPGRYYLRVRAVGAGGLGWPSAELVVTVGAQGCTTPPRQVDPPVVSVVNGAVVLAWTSSPGSVPTAYLLLVGTEAQNANLAVAPLGGATSFAATGVPPGAFFLRLVAENACGTSPPSADAVARVGGVPGPPGAPHGVTSTTGPGSVSLAWTTSTAGGAPTSHLLEVGTAPGLSNLGAVPLGPGVALATGGVPAGTYYLRVRALNASGRSPASGEVILVVP